MSIASEITRINNNIASAYTQCQSKGATLPQDQNSDNLATTIASISGGGGADLNDYFNNTIDYVSTSSTVWWETYLVKRIPKITIASGITDLTYAFYKIPFDEIAFDGLDCSNITSLWLTFANSSSAVILPGPRKIDFANVINTNNITSVRSLFEYQKKLEQIDNMFSLTGNVDVRSAFSDCSNLTKLDLSNWALTGTGSGRSQNMFRNCNKLAVLDISNMDLHNFSSTGNMFTNCGINCLQTDGAYADGIPYIYVKDATEQAWVLNQGSQPSTWTTNNVVIKQ